MINAEVDKTTGNNATKLADEKSEGDDQFVGLEKSPKTLGFLQKGPTGVALDNGSIVEIKAGSTVELLNGEMEGKLSAKEIEEPHVPSIEERENLFSKYSFRYLNPLVDTAQKEMIWHHHLVPLGSDDHCGKVIKRFDVQWEKQLARKAQEKEKGVESNNYSALLWAIYFMNDSTFNFAACLEILARGSLFVTPFILDYIIQYLQGKGEQGVWYGVILSLCFGGCIAISGIAENRMQALLARISFNMQASIVGKIYYKYFKLSPDSLAKTGTGIVLNMIGEDTQRIFQLMPIVNYLWSAPLQMLTVLILLSLLVGWAPTLGSLGVLLVVLVIMRWSNDKMQKLEGQRAKLMDKRVKFFTELISGMKAVKLYAWEEPMKEAVEVERKKELTRILHIYLLRAMNVALFNMAPVLMSVVIFYIYVSQGNDLEPALVFGTIALVGLIRAPLIILPILQTAYNSSTVSFSRIHDFLVLSERKEEERKEVSPRPLANSALPCVQLRGAFHWPTGGKPIGKKEKKSASPSNSTPKSDSSADERGGNDNMKDMKGETKSSSKPPFTISTDISIKPGDLLQIVGPVGSGKSSLLSALLGNMNSGRGDLSQLTGLVSPPIVKRSLHGRIAYVPQRAWVMNKTLKENITFGHEYTEEKYRKTLWLCALEPDLKQLPQGDMTMIGEQGINLSGGQKQRVALARAIYADADIYLLDDPLSAVDQHVAAHIFFCAIHTYLKDKAVILATHQVQFLKYASEVAVLEKGKTVAKGSYESLRTSHLSNYPQVQKSKWLSEGHSIDYVSAHKTSSETEKEQSANNAKTDSNSINPPAQVSKSPIADQKASEEGGSEGKASETKVDVKGDAAKKPAYTPQQGLPLSVHLTYFRFAAPLWAMFFLLIFFILTQVAILATEYWLAAWTGDFFNQSESFYMVGYGVLAVVGAVIAFSRIVLYAFAARNASKNIHDGSVNTLMDATMRYFDQTPMGSITALFSRDQSMIDTFLPELYNVTLTLLLMLIVTLLAVAVIVPWFFLAFIPLLFVAYRMQRYALPAVGNIQILNLMSLGPVFSFFQESMSGAAVIRASGREKYCLTQVEALIDTLNNAYYHSQLMIKWVDIRMDMFSAFTIFLCALIVVLSKDSLNIELAALVLTFALSVGALLGFIVQIRAYMEMMLTAVLRCDNFAKNTPRERFNGAIQPEKDWPSSPSIEFENVAFRYGDGTDSKGPLVLKDLSLSIPSGKKTAVIGRTGAGKSSLTAALLRVNELADGRVKIGGDPVHDVPVRMLRDKVAVIPQDPVLFTGTIRFNLDPFDRSTDDEIWETLRRVQLKEVVENQHGGKGLYSPVRENGSNFSIGQRQLFCVARALLKNSKILIMDEATASVDYATDAKIQKILRSEFKDCTILTIAHRIQTILDYDLVLALEKGKVVEFGSTSKLLENPKSYFSQLLTEEQKDERKKSDEADAVEKKSITL